MFLPFRSVVNVARAYVLRTACVSWPANRMMGVLVVRSGCIVLNLWDGPVKVRPLSGIGVPSRSYTKSRGSSLLGGRWVVSDLHS